MSIQALAPVSIDIVNFTATQVAIPIGRADMGNELVVQNESPVPLRVTIGPNTYHLGAFVADKYVYRGHLFVILTPQNPAISMQAQGVPPGVTSAATIMFNTVGDSPIPGDYPQALSRQTSTSSSRPFLGNLFVVGIGNTASKVFPLPAGTEGISVLIDNPGALSLCQLVTGTSHIDLFGAGGFFGSAPVLSAGRNLYRFAMDISVDTAVTATIKSSGAACNAWYSALLDPEVFLGSVLGTVSVQGAPPTSGPIDCVDVNFSGASFANNTSFTIKPGVNGQSVYLWTVHFSMDTQSSGMTIEDGNGKVLWRSGFSPQNSTTVSAWDTPMGGPPGGLSQPLLLFNRTGAARNAFGSIGVSQG